MNCSGMHTRAHAQSHHKCNANESILSEFNGLLNFQKNHLNSGISCPLNAELMTNRMLFILTPSK